MERLLSLGRTLQLHRRRIQAHLLRETRRFHETHDLPSRLECRLSIHPDTPLCKCDNDGEEIRSVFPRPSWLVLGDNVFWGRAVDGRGVVALRFE
jgi:hypothetical protein